MLGAASQRLRSEVGGAVSMHVIGQQEPIERATTILAPDVLAKAVAAGEALSVEDAAVLALAGSGESLETA